MKSYKNLYPKLCSYKNLESAFKKAKEGKSSNPNIIKFEENLEEELKKLKREDLNQVCKDIREFIIKSLSDTGGHLGGSIGATDLCVAMHYVFNSPTDKFIFDVGYQAYAHKILTGRKDLAFRINGNLALSIEIIFEVF